MCIDVTTTWCSPPPSLARPGGPLLAKSSAPFASSFTAIASSLTSFKSTSHIFITFVARPSRPALASSARSDFALDPLPYVINTISQLRRSTFPNVTSRKADARVNMARIRHDDGKPNSFEHLCTISRHHSIVTDQRSFAKHAIAVIRHPRNDGKADMIVLTLLITIADRKVTSRYIDIEIMLQNKDIRLTLQSQICEQGLYFYFQRNDSITHIISNALILLHYYLSQISLLRSHADIIKTENLCKLRINRSTRRLLKNFRIYGVRS